MEYWHPVKDFLILTCIQSEMLNTNCAIGFDVKPCVQSGHILLALMLFVLPYPASAGVPLTAGDNENFSQAMHISDPEKSWTVYGSLYGNMTHYYSFDVEKGERIYLSLFKSTDRNEQSFSPELLLIGPKLTGEVARPGLTLLPGEASDLEIMAAEPKSASAAYEPFGPSSLIVLSEINITAPETARYYAAVLGNEPQRNGSGSKKPSEAGNLTGTTGHYGLDVGYREKLSFSDRIITPIRLISLYLWEGQSLGLILTPYLVAEVLALLFFWRGSRKTSYSLAGSLAGFLFLATSAQVFNQMVFSLTRAPFEPSVYITFLVAAFHALLGVSCIRLARGEAGILQRSLLAVLGTLALLAGSGLIMGPLMAMASSFLPSVSGSIFGRSSLTSSGKR
jgi:hypothetical protein